MGEAMTKSFAFIFTILISVTFTQINAVTETGDQVILNNDGTWSYEKYSENKYSENKNITTNHQRYTKKWDSDFLVKSKISDVGFWINTKSWNFERGSSDDDFEYFFENESNELWGIAIVEKLSIPYEMMPEIVIEIAESGGLTNTKINKTEYRYVNDNKILLVDYQGDMYGIEFNYISYILSNEKIGTVQYIAYTTTDLKNKYKYEIEAFLNGIDSY